MLSKEAKLKFLAQLGQRAAKFGRQAAGLSQGEKFLSKPIRNTARILSKPQIPGLDRPTTAGPVMRAGWNPLRHLSPSRPAMPGRSFDRVRQGLAHAVRGTGRASVGASVAGAGVGLYDGIPSQVADTMTGLLNVRPSKGDWDSMVSKIRSQLPKTLMADLTGGDTSTVSKFHRDVLKDMAVPYARDQLYTGQRHNEYGRLASKLRWLNPLGAIINTAVMPNLEKSMKQQDYEDIVNRNLSKHYKGLIDPRQAAENVASPYTEFYRKTIPTHLLNPRTLDRRYDIFNTDKASPYLTAAVTRKLPYGPVRGPNNYDGSSAKHYGGLPAKQAITPLGALALRTYQESDKRWEIVNKGSKKFNNRLADYYWGEGATDHHRTPAGQRHTPDWYPDEASATGGDGNGSPAKYTPAWLAAEGRKSGVSPEYRPDILANKANRVSRALRYEDPLMPEVANVGDEVSRGLQKFIRKGGGYLKQSPESLYAARLGIYSYLRDKGYNVDDPTVQQAVDKQMNWTSSALSVLKGDDRGG